MQTVDWSEIGQRIARRRAECGWTQRQLAAQAGVSQRTVATAEAGANVRMGVPVLYGFARALGLSMDALLAQEESSYRW
jgi:transcriptional regulator with XRE-family HTH domain